ncbi:MAG TPA: ankyrin repeat domain-containing protein [Verrucomicrobiales bacterium]|nr:ankyrin repeat domain-containing protein [Verrucomicrobiales bacterium]
MAGGPQSGCRFALRAGAQVALTALWSGAVWAAEEPALADAAQRGEWDRVLTLLREGAKVDAAQADGTTALHWAAHIDEANALRVLLEAGASADAGNRYGVRPLHLACVNGNEEIVEALLAAGSDPNGEQRGGETPLMTAARTGRPGPVRALLERGARIEAQDRKGQCALMWAAADGHAEVVEILIAAGGNPGRRLRSGFTPMLFAARQGQIEVVHTLLRHGADPNEAIETKRPAGGRAPRHGMSALLFAVENGHFQLALELIAAGAGPNDQRSGFTPLHALSWVRKPNRGDDESGQPPPQGSGSVNSLEFVRKLVAAGADVDSRLEKGDSGRGKLNLTGATPFLLAARTADLPLMQLLVELGADPAVSNADGATPLMAAAGLGCLAPTEEAGTERECVAAVEYVLSLGAEVNSVDRNGETAMHGAAYKSLPQMVKLLEKRGAEIELWNRKNKYGWTPLLIAEGFRPGNFKPSAETLAALHEVMRAAGIDPPPPTARPVPKVESYEDGD